nr:MULTISPECIES: hypothetical protein [unclassified Streptomyces]
MLPSFTRWQRLTEPSGDPLTRVRATGNAAIAGTAPGLRAHADAGRLTALSRQLLATVHLWLLDLAQYTVLLSPEGPVPYGVDQAFADFRDDASARIPARPSLARPLAGGRA